MTADWQPLRAELKLWRRSRQSLPIWWRDDDAVAATPALERLADLSDGLGLPVHIAVIPDLVQPSLSGAVAARASLIPLVHGWRHENHAPAGAKKAEFGHPRPEADAELKAGIAQLGQVFGTRLLPMFVPPWNRLDPAFLPALVKARFRAVSTFQPRETAHPLPGLTRVNTHVDPIFWRGNRDLADPEALIHSTVALLRDRRLGVTDASEPLGLLTHHLVHTEEIWRFSGAFLATLLEGGAQVADLRAMLGA